MFLLHTSHIDKLIEFPRNHLHCLNNFGKGNNPSKHSRTDLKLKKRQTYRKKVLWSLFLTILIEGHPQNIPIK